MTTTPSRPPALTNGNGRGNGNGLGRPLDLTRTAPTRRPAAPPGTAGVVLMTTCAVGIIAFLPLDTIDTLRTLFIPIAVLNFALLYIAIAVRRTWAERLKATVLAPAILTAVGFAGLLYYQSGWAAERSATSGRRNILLESRSILPGQYVPTLSLMLVASVCILLGARCWRRERDVAVIDWSGLEKARMSAIRHSRMLLGFAFAPLAMEIVGYGPLALISRDKYIDPNGIVTLLRAGGALSVAGTIIACMVMALPVPRMQRRAALAIFIAYIVINFSFGSRELSLAPAAYLFGTTVARWRLPRWRTVVACVVLTFAIYSLPFTLRHLDSHGLGPYSSYVVQNPSSLVNFDTDRVLENVLSNFGLTGYVSFNVDHLDTSYFVDSVSPLPSGFVGYDTAGAELKVTKYAPYGALGELGNHGLPFLVGFCLLAGVVFSMIDKAASRMRTPMAIMIMRVLSAGTGVITTLMLLQYHLRSVARLLEVAFVLIFVMRWLDRRLDRRRALRRPTALRRAASFER